jgi:hypothetical protein
MSWTQSVIERKAEMKQLHPTCLIQGLIAHRYFWEGGQARFPTLSFSPYSTYSRWGSLLWLYLPCRGIRPPLNSGLMTVLSQLGQFSAFGNSLPSFSNQEWKTEKRHECANMGKVKWLKLWWQLYVMWLPERNVQNIGPMDFCLTECTCLTWCVVHTLCRSTLELTDKPSHAQECVLCKVLGTYKQLLLN